MLLSIEFVNKLSIELMKTNLLPKDNNLPFQLFNLF
jgi:hypothetical protein